MADEPRTLTDDEISTTSLREEASRWSLSDTGDDDDDMDTDADDVDVDADDPS